MSFNESSCVFAKGFGGILNFINVQSLNAHTSQSTKGRIQKVFTQLKFCRRETFVIMLATKLNTWMINVVSLNDHFTGRLVATSATTHLHEKLKASFASAK